MKYFSSESVANAYMGFQGSITNKSWGVLAIMHQLDSMIVPGRTYAVNCSSLSTYIEKLFCLGSKKSYIDNGKEWYVKFSTQWNDFFDKQGQTIPNIFDIIVWAYRTSPLPDDITHDKLLAMFAKDFHLSVDDINNTFDTREKRIEYNDTLYSDSNLLSIVAGKLGTSLSKNITADGKSVAASPGELSRGPFVQPLYAALDTADYILVSQTNFDELYPMGGPRKNILTSLNEDNKNTDVYLSAIRTKPFLLLAGISGTGKSRIVRELAFKSCPKYLQDKDGTTPGNYCMIEVKPNWHDSTELLGYYSNLSNGYQFKKFVKFLVKAKLNPNVPFFICLDEMNLAPVEHYFAEILSILETRKHPKKKDSDEVDMDVIKTGTIVESQYFKRITWTDKDGALHQKADMSDKDWYEFFFDMSTMSEDEKKQIAKYQYERTLQNEGLTLPDNVIIIGTVNMDDTTHQFSRKVIDRAMTIEMNGGKLSDMYGGSKDLEYLDETEQEKWQKAFVQRYVTADEVLKKHSEVADKIIEEVPGKLENINKALKGTPFEVSYRVLNELTIMIGVLLDDPTEEGDIDSIIDKALDRIMLMKILPRIEGDADMFNLSSEFKKKNDTTHNNRLEWLKELAPNIVTSEDEPHQQTAREKIQEMIDRLGNQEFTRFWP